MSFKVGDIVAIKNEINITPKYRNLLAKVIDIGHTLCSITLIESGEIKWTEKNNLYKPLIVETEIYKALNGETYE